MSAKGGGSLFTVECGDVLGRVCRPVDSTAAWVLVHQVNIFLNIFHSEYSSNTECLAIEEYSAYRAGSAGAVSR